MVSGDEGNPGCLRRTREGGARTSSRCASCPACRRGDVGSAASWLLSRARPPRHVTARPRVRAAGARERGGAAPAWGSRRRGDRDVAAPRAAESSLGSSARHSAGAAGGTMNVFRILGDLSHLLAMILLLVKIWRSKSCAGERPPRWGGAGRDWTRVRTQAQREPGRASFPKLQ